MAAPEIADTVRTQPRHRPLFLLGVLLFILGLAIYVIQISMKQFVTPWYMPILGAAGVLLMLVSVWRRPGVFRILGLLVFMALCGYTWYFLLVETKLPAYTGPARAGQKLPEFSASLSDGTPFTNADLEKGTPTVLVFFRGHW
jgi:hypothetical protein